MISLAGRAALVTGGSRGIGAATVKLFAQAGADVVFSYHRNRHAAVQVEEEARKQGTRIETFKADAGKMRDTQRLVQFAIERLGRLDILIANAGIWNYDGVSIEHLTERDWEQMIRVNLKGVYAVVHHAVPYPLKRIATPQEVAGPILFAVSDLATFITGEVINVNGGSFLCG